MAGEADFDLVAAHKHFSAWCFNRAWELIEKPDRTEAEVRWMEALSPASIFHWISRPDCTGKNLAVGYWQASRIQALIGNVQEAMRYAQTCLGYSTNLEPFYLGYAYEALARAARLMDDAANSAEYIEKAESLAEQVQDEQDRKLLTADLAQLRTITPRQSVHPDHTPALNMGAFLSFRSYIALFFRGSNSGYCPKLLG
jgi:tetratricopeptide (TPR) repeat protein